MKYKERREEEDRATKNWAKCYVRSSTACFICVYVCVFEREGGREGGRERSIGRDKEKEEKRERREEKRREEKRERENKITANLVTGIGDVGRRCPKPVDEPVV